MSFVLVGDNRSANNWGGRSAGLALFSLLESGLGAGSSILGRELSLAAATCGFRSRLLPGQHSWRARAWAAGSRDSVIAAAAARLDRALGGGDFLDLDPDQSVRNLLDRRSTDPGLQEFHDRISGAEAVIINGEGDVVLGRPLRRQILFFAAMADLGRQLGKPVAFVNAMLSDAADTGRDPEIFDLVQTMLRRCDLITVRDPRSLDLVRHAMGIRTAQLIPDALFHWFDVQLEARKQLPACGDFILAQPERQEWLGKLDFSGDYICIGGNSAVTGPGMRERVAASTRDLCAEIAKLGYPVYLVVADGRDSFLEDVARELGLGLVPVGTPIFLAAAILGRARLLVSGRYHPSIMAALGGTPCIFLDANVHKMASLAEMLGYDEDQRIPADPGPTEIARIVEMARTRIESGEALRQRIGDTARRHAAEVVRLPALIREVMPVPVSR